MTWLKKGWLWLLIGVVLLGVGAWRIWWVKPEGPKYRTAQIEKGRLVAAVAATGTLQPVISVQVGSQVSGQLKEVLVDFNSPVSKNQLIARIDPESFEYRVRQAQADLDAARAQVATQTANIAAQRALVSQVEVNYADTQRDFERKQQLVAKNFISPAETDKARAVMNALAEQLKSALAQVDVAKANAGNAAAVVRQREAALSQARVDLERTAIRSPVSGVVIKRSVDKGQTVAASLQSPELFIIAENLADMRVDTAVDESEIGKIRIGQKASFTVDAFAGKTFEGEVKQVRKSAQVISNVVTYLVGISTPNADQKLFPGMTANVRIVTEIHESVLKVPNAALRFRPPRKDDDSSGKGASKSSSKDGGKAGAKEGNGGAKEASGEKRGRGGRPDPGQATLYVLKQGELEPMVVKLGPSDGKMTEIISDTATEGLEIVIGVKGAPGSEKARGGQAMGAPRMF
jgi:HlyD family secretion protein